MNTSRVIIDTESKNIFGNETSMTREIYSNLKEIWTNSELCMPFRFPVKAHGTLEFEMLGGWRYSKFPDYILENKIVQGDFLLLTRRVNILEQQARDLQVKFSILEEKFNEQKN